MSGYRNTALPADLLPPPDRWPSRETALALISAIEGGQAYDWQDLEEATGITEASQVIQWCFNIYGYPTLSPAKVAVWYATASMSRPSKTLPQPVSMPPERPSAFQVIKDGFNR